jgi:hypothetical protein
VGRYPFDVELFHLLLHAGLSRRFPNVNDGRKLTPYRRSKVDPLLAC